MENKIDTQGMSAKAASPFSTPSTPPENCGPRQDDSTRPVFSQLEREELKDIIRESLNEWWKAQGLYFY